MAEITPRLGLEVPEGSDYRSTLGVGPEPIREAIQTLDDAAMFGSSVHASRPAPSLAGRIWLSTDTGQVSLDTGSAWIELARTVVASTPPGVVLGYGGAAAPDGWLLCDGAAVSRSTYAALFAVLGATYGPGNGSTTFNVPDFRGRTAVGAGAGPGLTTRTRGQMFGAETLPAHAHAPGSLSVQPGGAHSHGIWYTNVWVAAGTGLARGVVVVPQDAPDGGNGAAETAAAHTHTLSGTTATTGTGSHGVMQPSTVVNYIIKT